MFGLRDKRTYSQIMRDELDEGFDHLWQAGAAAAAGLGATFGPRWADTKIIVAPPANRLRDAATQSWGSTVSAVAPLVSLARAEAGRATRRRREQEAKKRGMSMSRRGWLTFGGIAAAGVVAGIAGTLIMRRRRRAQWDEYDAQAEAEMARGEAALATGMDRPESAETIESTGDGARRPGSGRSGTSESMTSSEYSSGTGHTSKGGRSSS